MTMSSDSPTFNLKAVVQETGISADTLRAWERRYGVPQPGRSSGRQRLYSRADVDLLKWLVARQTDGISISRAADMWKRTIGAHGQATRVSAVPPPIADSFGDLSAAWVRACLDFDGDRADQILSQAFALFPPSQVCENVIQRGLIDVGHRWYDGSATVHQEHFASELAVRQVERLIAAAPAPWRTGRVVIGCVAQESHTLTPLLFTLTLRLRGWDALFLGADVPVDWYGVTNVLAKPSLVVLSAQRLTTAARLRVAANALVEIGTPPAYAGRIFNTTPMLQGHISGYFLGETMTQAAAAVEALHERRPPLPATVPVTRDFQTTIDHFRHRQLSIEADFERELRVAGVGAAKLLGENLNLTQSIAAALAFGDLSLITADLEWARGLLAGRGISELDLVKYLAAYERAAQSDLDERGGPILAWLRSVSGLDGVGSPVRTGETSG